jgi:hypothetical protein
MARKASKALEEQGYSKLDAYCIALNEYYKSLRKAGFNEGLALFMITDKESYPGWILPDPVEPNRLGDYEDEDDD